MSKRIGIFIALTVIFIMNCQKSDRLSGVLEIPDTIFQYSAEGKGIPCFTFTGSENIGNRLYSKDFRKKFLIIHANPSKIPADQIENLTLAKIIEDVEKARVALGLEKVAVMGHSMFGPLPLEYALRYPNHISHAILSGATPFMTQKFFVSCQEYWESEASELRKNILNENLKNFQEMDMSNMSDGEKFIQQYIAYTPYRFHDPSFDMSTLWDGVEINMAFVNHFWTVLLRDFDNTIHYKRIKTPVLVIAGKYDFGAPYYLWQAFEDKIPDLTLHVFENAGHNPMLEIPDEFNRVVFSWIDSKQ